MVGLRKLVRGNTMQDGRTAFERIVIVAARYALEHAEAELTDEEHQLGLKWKGIDHRAFLNIIAARKMASLALASSGLELKAIDTVAPADSAAYVAWYLIVPGRNDHPPINFVLHHNHYVSWRNQRFETRKLAVEEVSEDTCLSAFADFIEAATSTT